MEGPEVRPSSGAIVIEHNLDPARFMWLWAKYVRGIDDTKHCTACLKGWYSKRLSGHNVALRETPRLVMDEHDAGAYRSIYVCGVAKQGYARHLNYPYNLHTAVLPAPGRKDSFRFERWELQVTNGIFDPIPSLEDLPGRFRALPDEFTTCRIFRWAVCRGAQLVR
jgi:hypothetical protein